MPLAPFVRTGSGAHFVIDRDALLEFYGDLELGLCNISSPSHLVAWEVLRERHAFVDPSAVPCDLFVWGRGEPPDQRLTRVGGVPFFPKGEQWPEIDGVVTSFLCQFDFRDSYDLVQTPGDLLLVFCADNQFLRTRNEDVFRFAWVSASESDVIAASDVPEPTHPFEFAHTWGVRHRSIDLPGCWDRAFASPDHDWLLPVFEGTKIGGVPYHSQEAIDHVPDGYLCQLVSIAPSATTWPWVDREAPLEPGNQPGRWSAKNNRLMIGDVGEITFYVEDDGFSVSVEVACT